MSTNEFLSTNFVDKVATFVCVYWLNVKLVRVGKMLLRLGGEKNARGEGELGKFMIKYF